MTPKTKAAVLTGTIDSTGAAVSCAVTAPLVKAPLAPVPLLRTTPFCLKILILEFPISFPSALFATEIAAGLTGTIDSTGAVTGVTGATYYNTNSWQDMIDTYKSVIPNAASKATVFFNVTANVPGNPWHCSLSFEKSHS